jgi:hypothetical protein
MLRVIPRRGPHIPEEPESLACCEEGDVMQLPYDGRKPEPPYDCPSCADRDAQLDRLGDELAEAHLEIARQRALLYGARCIYCDFTVSPEVCNQDLGDQVLREHIAQCDKHPLRQVRQEIARLSSLLVAESELRLVAEASLHNLEHTTRKVVEVLVDAKHTLEWTKGKEPEWERGSIALIDAVLADPVVARLTIAHQEAEQSLLALTGDRYAALQSATRRVVEALDRCESNRGRFSRAALHDGRCSTYFGIPETCNCGADELVAALTDPVIVALRRE